MIRIDLHAFWGTVTCDTLEESSWLAECATIRGGFNPVAGVYRNVVSMVINNHVMGGIAPLLASLAVKDGVDLTITEAIKTDPGKMPAAVAPGGGAMRQHQLDAVNAARHARRGIIKCPTGSGKTLIGVAIRMLRPGLRTLILVPSPTLSKNHTATLDANGVEYEVLRGPKTTTSANTIIATLAWAHNNLDAIRGLLKTIDVVIMDECHQAAAATYRPVLMACDRAAYRYGLSATPTDRADDLGIVNIGLLGKVIYTVPVDALIADKAIAAADVCMVEFMHENMGDAEAVLKTKWATRYNRNVVKNAARNKLVVATVGRAAKPCVVFVQEINHLHEVVRLLEAEGHAVAWVDGGTPLARRQTIIQQVETGHIDIIVSSRVFEQGVDMPSVLSVVNAGAMKAVIGTAQRMGRGMRVAAGKHSFEMWDIYDRVHKALEKQAHARCDIYRNQGHNVIIEKAGND